VSFFLELLAVQVSWFETREDFNFSDTAWTF